MFYNKLEDTVYPWMKWFKSLDEWYGTNFRKMWYIMIPYAIPHFFIICPLFIILNRFDKLIDMHMNLSNRIIDHESRNKIVITLQVLYMFFIALPPVTLLCVTYLAPQLVFEIINHYKEKKLRRNNVQQTPTVFEGVNDTIRQRRLQPIHTYQHDVIGCDTIVSGKVKKHTL